MQTQTFFYQLVALCVVQGAVPECVLREAGERKRCYKDSGLQLTDMPDSLGMLVPSYESYETFFTLMDPHTHCRDPTRYAEAATCSLNISRNCHDPDGSLRLVPDSRDVLAGLQRLCDVKDQVDSRCFKVFFNAVMDCVQYHLQHLDLTPLRATTQQLTCSSAALQYDCFQLLMKPMCGENTTNIYLEQMDTYQLAPVCKNGSEPSRRHDRFFQELQVVTDEHSGAATIATTAVTATAVSTLAGLVARRHLLP